MENKGGLVLLIEAKRERDVKATIEERGYFTDTISKSDSKFSKTGICLIAFDGYNLEGVALIKKSPAIATSKIRIRIESIEFFNLIESEEILNLCDKKFSRRIVEVLHIANGGYLPNKTWEHLLSIIKQIEPSAYKTILKLTKKATQITEVIKSKGADIVAYEKDAIGLALDIADCDRKKVLSEWRIDDHEKIAPFLKGLPSVNMIEDEILNHDSNAFGDWTRLEDSYIGESVFINHKNGKRLTVKNFNRTSVEHTLGVDLIYYNHHYRSYVMVQYNGVVK